MPLRSSEVSTVPKESPLTTNACLTWAMNFAAGCDAIRPCFLDNTAERRPLVHPLFLSGCVEIVGAWGCVYAAGVTKAEVIKSTFVHHTLDCIMSEPMFADDVVHTDVTLAGVGQRRSGGHFVAHFEHRRVRGGTANSQMLGQSWVGGVLLGLAPVGEELYSCQPPERLNVMKTADALEVVAPLVLSCREAHLWDACIRDPRRPKAKSADINPHTNVDFARRAGLDARNLNGLCVLAHALSVILELIGVRQFEAWPMLRRIACTFASPVFIDYEPVHLDVHVLAAGSSCSSILVVEFEVLTAQGRHAIRDGYLEVLRADVASKL